MAKIVTVANQKGGVGKTTTVVTLAHALGKLKKKVLVIDMDPQHNATMILCPPKLSPYDMPLSVIEVLIDDEVTLQMCITPSKYDNVDFVNSHIDLFATKNALANSPKSFFGLKDKIDEEARSAYDYILIDTPPDLGGPLVNNALVVSDYYLVTLEADSYFALKGMQQFQKSCREILSINKELKMLGVLVTIADLRTNVAKAMVKTIEHHFGEGNIFSTKIPRNVAINRAFCEHRETVIASEPKESGAKAYTAFAREFVEWAEREK